MSANTIEQEYDSVACEFGRRAANRWLYATMYNAGKRDFTIADFYAMYGDESALPEAERARNGGESVLLGVTLYTMLYSRNDLVGGSKNREDWSQYLSCMNQYADPFEFKLTIGIVLMTEAERGAFFDKLQAAGDQVSLAWADWIDGLTQSDLLDLWILIVGRRPIPGGIGGSDRMSNEDEMLNWSI